MTASNMMTAGLVDVTPAELEKVDGGFIPLIVGAVAFGYGCCIGWAIGSRW